jgi:hypothetical protein
MTATVRLWIQPAVVGRGPHYLAGETYAANVTRLLDVKGGRVATDFLRGLPASTLDHVTRGSGQARHAVLVVRDAGELIAAARAAGVTVRDERN